MSLTEHYKSDPSASQSSNTIDDPVARRMGQTALTIGFVVLLAAVYGRLMGYGLRRDEMMFVPPARFLGDLQLYQDVFYNHVPYSAWYFRGFNLIFGAGGLLFSARMGIFAAWLFLAGITSWITLRLSGSTRMAVFAAVATLTCHPLMNEPGMAASNNLLQLPFALAGLGLFLIELQENKFRWARLFASGLCLSIATGMKVSAVAFIPPVAIAAFLLPAALPFAQRIRRVALPILLGGMLGAVPLFILLFTDPQLFLAHIVKFHTGPHVAYWEANRLTEPDLALGLGSKAQLAYGIWLEGVPLITGFVILCFGWMAFSENALETPENQPSLGPVVVVLGTLLTTALMSFLPTPGFSQYYVAPLILLPILAALMLNRVPKAVQQQSRPVLAAAALLCVLTALPWLGPDLRTTLGAGSSTPHRMNSGGRALEAVMSDRGIVNGKVATFLPIYPLEAGLDVYPELATGQFAYRIAPYTDPELAKHYVMAGADEITSVFDKEPPAAFLLGYEPTLEEPLLRYAISKGYRKVSVDGLNNRYGEGRVYLQPGESIQ
ncbi:glycosyltransferase family 39 protein [Aliiroseovarius sp. F20344]|uniref:ArnT family glycosyltransferase n=1 Tax=Aliiroseovarius sp. F20344 TaxID=2926414 RepID=UPI001FF36EA5|nr:glycosyltransferase family 39 protein [Aliiroseovarius sp. F20344]MCK0143099.1 glycosyltransferase family 39 protein [Aliiroseovarius sp. F20344]